MSAKRLFQEYFLHVIQGLNSQDVCFLAKKIKGSILLAAILNQKPSCQTNLVFLYDDYVMYVKR